MLNLSIQIKAPSVHGAFLPTEDVPEINIWRDSWGNVAAFLSRSSGDVGIYFPRFASYTFPEMEASQERIWIIAEPAPAATPQQLIDQLMRNVVPLLLQSRGFQVLHASAIRFRTGVVGLCGKSFAGKSTLAYALGKRGHEVWTDDSLLISADHEDILTLKLSPVELRLRSDSREYFGEGDHVFSTQAGDIGSELEISLSAIHEAPLQALCLIERVSEKKQVAAWRCGKIKGCSAFQKILSLANYYNLAECAEHRRISESCLNLARNVPIYSCQYRDGFDFIEEVIDAIEDSFLNVQ